MNDVVCLTGIPRSGTTLCCKLLNQHSSVTALHEPLNPASIPPHLVGELATNYVVDKINDIREAIIDGRAFENGDQSGLDVDNPVGTTEAGGIRQVSAKRGLIQLPKPHENFTLVVKQNALFTALLPQLMQHFNIVCIVRNPVDVMLSWLSVNLPVNRGRLPAGERFSSELTAAVQGLRKGARQVAIYQWFIDQFIHSGLPIVRYEDMMASSGRALDTAMGLSCIYRDELAPIVRTFQPDVLASLRDISEPISKLNCGELYSKSDIVSALRKYDAC